MPSKDLTDEAATAILEAIKAAAPTVSDNRLPGLAYAYALVVGAKIGHLPGELTSSS